MDATVGPLGTASEDVGVALIEPAHDPAALIAQLARAAERSGSAAVTPPVARRQATNHRWIRTTEYSVSGVGGVSKRAFGR
jgi:hypothetical protein